MSHIISNITYGLIATSCSVLFVCGGVLVTLCTHGAITKKKTWYANLVTLGGIITGAALIAIALHFTL